MVKRRNNETGVIIPRAYGDVDKRLRMRCQVCGREWTAPDENEVPGTFLKMIRRPANYRVCPAGCTRGKIKKKGGKA